MKVNEQDEKGLRMRLLVRNEERLDAMIEELKSKCPDHNISIEEKHGSEVWVRLTPKQINN